MKIAITGGIGAGKSYVCQCLKEQGIEVFDCDASAKRLMRTSPALQQALKELVGEEVYEAPSLKGDKEFKEFKEFKTNDTIQY